MPQAPRTYGEETAREIDCAVRDIVATAFAHAVETLTRLRDRLERGAALLLEKETLTEPELLALVSGAAAPPRPATPVAASR
jgi:cell division protease FtsH